DCLGNLVLITQQENDRARNASWAEKKEIYGKVSSDKAPLLAITRDVLGERDWRRPEIEVREQRLLGLIEKLWRIDIQSQRPASRSIAQVQEQAKTLPPLA
ncbi:MAG TPA: HNH endonuclease family protein, partial [Hyphomicrobium sp.]